MTPGGEKVTLEGTVQEVHAQLLKLNPNWDSDFNFNAPRADLVARTDFNPSDTYYCGGRFYTIATSGKGYLDEGISYLRGIGGVPVAPANQPGWCSRVSCSNDASITWCNDVSVANRALLIMVTVLTSLCRILRGSLCIHLEALRMVHSS